ncbi:hypothetical protein COLU111180_00140 [Cohnella lubricantis]|nr:hypothetical protein [Cohnella lubricantis]
MLQREQLRTSRRDEIVDITRQDGCCWAGGKAFISASSTGLESGSSL